MARAKSERARSKAIAIDDLTQSIEQLQAFLPKLEDLGREGFPYLEGALTRTELQLRECIKRAFGDKSPEFQTHRHLKLALASATEKKQTLTLIRTLIASLEDKKSELQGLKPAAQDPAPAPTPAPMALVPPTSATPQVSVTSVTTTSRPASTTLHLVPGVEKTPPAAAPVAAAPPPAGTPTPPPMEPTPAPVVPPPTQSIPPRTPIEPISSLFRTQETKPLPSTPEPSPTPSAPVRVTAPSASPEASATAVPPPPPVPQPAAMTVAAPAAAPKPQAASGAFSTTQEVPTPAPMQTPPPTPVVTPSTAAVPEADHLNITKRICQRFHVVARQLRLRGEYRSTINVEDEFDVQDLMHALLRQHFDDIGTDEWTPAYSSSAPRTTYLLDHDHLAVVVKKTRTGLNRKDLADQVRVDIERYRDRGRFTHLLCFIYDPEGRIGNPRGLESELSTTSEHFAIDVVVAPK